MQRTSAVISSWKCHSVRSLTQMSLNVSARKCLLSSGYIDHFPAQERFPLSHLFFSFTYFQPVHICPAAYNCSHCCDIVFSCSTSVADKNRYIHEQLCGINGTNLLIYNQVYEQRSHSSRTAKIEIIIKLLL